MGFKLGLCFLSLLLVVEIASAQLSSTFYSTSCPTALSTIKTAVNTAITNEARMGASLLRLHFHDCFVNLSWSAKSTRLLDSQESNSVYHEPVCGCDASVLLDDTANFTGEKTAPTNSGSLRGFDVVDTIKTQLESSCPGVVSCADILAVAARDSVVTLGGNSWTVVLGRRDSTTASLSTTNSDIPGPGLSLSGLISSFSKKGFTTKEMVTLSGSHSIGQARCQNFRTRIYNETNINPTYRTTVQGRCPSSGGNTNLAPLDIGSATTFDNSYFTNLVNLKGLLHSDQQLFNNGSTDAQVTAYSTNSATFLSDFATAMVKMGNLSPLTGTNGQIRTNCRKTN